jgi:hypothetical protein
MTVKIWTIYFNPKDFPDQWVAREFELDKPTKSILRALNLPDLRELVQKHSDHDLFCMSRWI